MSQYDRDRPGDRAKLSPIVYGAKCQHPTARKEGVCGNPSVGTFDVPESYVATLDKRHAGTPAMPHGPDIRLCLGHSARVRAHVAALEGTTPPKLGSHESQCPVCQHPNSDEIVNLWVSWVYSTGQAARELGVTNRVFYNHVHHFDLFDKKRSKVNRNRALVIAAERGLEGGGHTVRSGLLALDLMRKEEGGDNDINVNVRGLVGIGVADITKLSDEQILALLVEMQQKSMTAGDRQAIDVPFKAVEREAPRPVRLKMATQPLD